MTPNEEFELLIKSNQRLIQINSYERERVYSMIDEIASELNADWYRWDANQGLWVFDKDEGKFVENKPELLQPGAILDYILKLELDEKKNPPIFLLLDFHPYLDLDKYPIIIEQFRDLVSILHPIMPFVVLNQPIKKIPDELVKEMSLFELELPTVEDLKVVFKQIIEKYNLEKSKYVEDDRIFEALLGLTIMEARLAFSKAIVEFGKLTLKEVPFLVQQKGALLKKKGFLEYIDIKENMSDVGGLDLLKDWLKRRSQGFSKGAKEFGVTPPRGALLLGVPGCGKSLSAKAIASEWQMPLLRFDVGKVFSQYIGASESNIREALSIAEALSPCILWIDEIEKGFSGVSSSDQTDSGVTARIFGTFLTWMQEKTKPVFVIMTANRVQAIPPELMRKGRLDEIFFVDLPTEEERKEIYQIHIKSKGRNLNKFELDKIVENSKDFTGAEIKESIEEGLYIAYSDGKTFDTTHILKAIGETKPLIKTMGDQLEELRTWAIHRTRFASSSAYTKNEALLKKIPPKAKQDSFLAFSKKDKKKEEISE